MTWFWWGLIDKAPCEKTKKQWEERFWKARTNKYDLIPLRKYEKGNRSYTLMQYVSKTGAGVFGVTKEFKKVINYS